MKPHKAGGRTQSIQTMLVIAALCSGVAAAQIPGHNTNSDADLFAPPRVEIRHFNAINLPAQAPLGKDEEARILGLIRNLANIQDPDFGLSPTLSGNAFAPIPEARNFGAGLITDHHIKESKDVLELVKLGPKALPFLLKSLDDTTRTRLVVKHDFGFMGGMRFANELRGNPANEAEKKVLATVPKPERNFPTESLSSYTVTIGDVCFVIIGQIVGRSYEAVRYQPTAIVILNSPTHDTNLTQEVRSIWSSPDPAQHLLDSLLLDYNSGGGFHGRSLDGWGVASSFQVSAAMRLLFFYPQQATNLIARRLRGLDARKYDMYRDVMNGVRADEFIKAIAWSKEPAIQAELQRIFKITTDPEILRTASVAMNAADPRACRERLEEFISNLPETEKGPFGDGYNFLVTLGQEFGVEARPAFDRYMQKASLQRRRSMCRVLLEVQGVWSIDLLAPLLDDTQSAEGWTYGVVPGQNEPRLPIRICDEAAGTISQNFPKLVFKMMGDHANLDAQIKKMKLQISRHDY